MRARAPRIHAITARPCVAFVLIAASAILGACGEEEPLGPGADDDAAYGFVSDPTPLPAAAAGAAAPGANVVYVSLAPGSIESAAEVDVLNTANGVEETIPVVGGGFDPVPIPAHPGDNLRFQAFSAPLGDGDAQRSLAVPEWRKVVPWTSPPIVVRSYPPRGKRDVPVSASLVVVFSEPIDEATVIVENFVLTRAGSRIAIDVARSPDGLRITIDPESPMLPETEYVLQIAGAIQDHDGDRYGRETQITFSTGAAGYEAVLAPAELCSDYPGASVATFEDESLENAVRVALGWAPWESLTCDAVASVTTLTHNAPAWTSSPPAIAIHSLVGMQNLTGLRKLALANNPISDVSPIASLTRLDSLSISGGNGALSDIGPIAGLSGLRYLNLNNTGGIADLGVLSGLSMLSELHIRNNQIVDIRPLGSLLYLRRLNLAANAIVDVSPLSALGQLTWLAVNDNLLTDISPIASLVGIGDKLWINGNRLTDLTAVGGLDAVTWLIASDNDFVDTDGLAGMASLSRALLNDNPRLADVGGLLANPNLAGDTIDISNTSVSCTDVSRLRMRDAFVISTCGAPPVFLSSRPLSDGRVGQGYAEVLTASGGDGVFTWSTTGGLPPGLALTGSGVIGGTPTAPGTWKFQVSAQSGATRGLANFTIVVAP